MIIMMGLAGSGKSMQGKLLADQKGYPWLSTGEFLRMLVTGSQRQKMLSGELLDDEEIISQMQKIFGLINTEDEFVLDGFPRTLAQAEWLLSQIKFGQLKATAVVHITIPLELAKSRLSSRGRQDDNDVAINDRLQTFQNTELPIIQSFKDANIPIYEVDGAKKPEEVHEFIIRHIKIAR